MRNRCFPSTPGFSCLSGILRGCATSLLLLCHAQAANLPPKTEVTLLVEAVEDRIYEQTESVAANLIDPPYDRLPDMTIDPQHNTAKLRWLAPPVGELVLTARAVDAKGNPVISKPVTVRVVPVALPMVSIVSLDPEATEFPAVMSYADWARFSIFREGDTSKDLYAVFSIHGTAQPNKDYRSPGNYVLIPAGQREAFIQIEPLGDDEAEPMETVVLRLEDPVAVSALPAPPTPYDIAPNAAAAAAVIYDHSPPTNPLLEIALPGGGDVYWDSQPIYVIAAAFHPTLDVTKAELYVDGLLVDTSSLSFVKLKPGGLVAHYLRWQGPVPGERILSAHASLPDGTVLVSSKVHITVRASGWNNTHPSVTIVRPQNGSVFTFGDTVEIVASAQDSDGSITKLELFGDGVWLTSSPASELAFKWPDIAAGQHTLVARATDDDGATTDSVPVKILVREVDGVAFVRRQLPAGYIPNLPLTVILEANPPPGSSAYAVEDQPPAGWGPTKISHAGAFDAATGRVKFGVFTDAVSRTLTYTLIPPPGTTAAQEFSGGSSVDGRLFPVGGDHTLLLAGQRHPADSSPADLAIGLAELTAYAAAWKQGQPWPEGPVPIPLTYVTRAAQLWKQGEKYLFDPSHAPPECWTSAGVRALARAATGTASQALREIVPGSLSGAPVLVQIRVTPGATVSAYAFEEQLPTGWTVQNVSEEGTFDTRANCIRWGVFLDQQPRTLAYRALPSAFSLGSPRGTLSCDGGQQRLGAAAEFGWNAGLRPPQLALMERGSGGKVRLQVVGAPGQLLVLESSSDLETWNDLASLFTPDGQVVYEDSSNTGLQQRFYRTRSP